MTGRQLALSDHVLHGIRQSQKAQKVRDVAAAFGQRLGHALLGMAETVHQLTKAHRLFDRIQIFALNVFNDRDFQNFGIVKIARNYRQFMDLRHLRGPPTTLSGDDLIGALMARRTHDQGLKNALRADRCRQVGQGRCIKIATWLKGVCAKLFNRNKDGIAAPLIVVCR